VSRTVQIKGDQPVFPANACVHCLQPAVHDIEIVKVKGYVVRKVRVPFCARCIALRQAKSHRQVLFERVAVTNSGLLAVAVAAWTYRSIASDIVPGVADGWVWGLLVAVLAALIIFGVMYLIVRPWSRFFGSAEARAALAAVQIKDFDWETTTLDFANVEYADRFARVNSAQSET
jgi:hypothetical protein